MEKQWNRLQNCRSNKWKYTADSLIQWHCNANTNKALEMRQWLCWAWGGSVEMVAVLCGSHYKLLYTFAYFAYVTFSQSSRLKSGWADGSKNVYSLHSWNVTFSIIKKEPALVRDGDGDEDNVSERQNHSKPKMDISDKCVHFFVYIVTIC